MDVDQLRQDVAEGRVELDRLVELIASQQKLIQQLQDQIEKLKDQIGKNPTERLDESYSEKAEDKRKAEAEGKPKKRNKPKRSGRVSTAEKIARASRTQKVYPDGCDPEDCKLSHTRVAWRLEDGRAVLIAYEIYRFGNNYGRPPGVPGRGEFGMEILIALAYQVYTLGLSLDKALQEASTREWGPAAAKLIEAVRNPSRIKRLVILNTLVYPQTSWAVKAFLIALRLPLVRDYVVSPKGIVGAMKFGVTHKDRLNRELLTPYTEPFEDASAQQALIKAGSGLSIKGLSEIAAKLPSLGVPVRLIYGEGDRILPDIAKTMGRLKSDLPGAELTSLPNAGHFLQEDAPERVAELIADFIN